MSDLLTAARLARSTYFYERKRVPRLTRPELHAKTVEIFSRTPNGCGHRQIAMVLRAEQGVRIANKTVLKIMHETGLHCRIRRRNDYRRYSSYKGIVGRTFKNVLARDFKARKPFEKIGTDVTEFKCAFGKAYLAPAYDFCSKEILAWSISRSPNMEQQNEMLRMLLAKLPKQAEPILHSDMGWQYQHKTYCTQLKNHAIEQSMSRKGNCLDNAATEQVFGHLKDEFFKGQNFTSYKQFKTRLENYIHYWNTKRRQVKLNGLTPEEFRNQSITTI